MDGHGNSWVDRVMDVIRPPIKLILQLLGLWNEDWD